MPEKNPFTFRPAKISNTRQYIIYNQNNYPDKALNNFNEKLNDVSLNRTPRSVKNNLNKNNIDIRKNIENEIHQVFSTIDHGLKENIDFNLDHYISSGTKHNTWNERLFKELPKCNDSVQLLHENISNEQEKFKSERYVRSLKANTTWRRESFHRIVKNIFLYLKSSFSNYSQAFYNKRKRKFSKDNKNYRRKNSSAKLYSDKIIFPDLANKTLPNNNSYGKKHYLKNNEIYNEKKMQNKKSKMSENLNLKYLNKFNLNEINEKTKLEFLKRTKSNILIKENLKSNLTSPSILMVGEKTNYSTSSQTFYNLPYKTNFGSLKTRLLLQRIKTGKNKDIFVLLGHHQRKNRYRKSTKLQNLQKQLHSHRNSTFKNLKSKKHLYSRGHQGLSHMVHAPRHQQVPLLVGCTENYPFLNSIFDQKISADKIRNILRTLLRNNFVYHRQKIFDIVSYHYSLKHPPFQPTIQPFSAKQNLFSSSLSFHNTLKYLLTDHQILSPIFKYIRRREKHDPDAPNYFFAFSNSREESEKSFEKLSDGLTNEYENKLMNDENSKSKENVIRVHGVKQRKKKIYLKQTNYVKKENEKLKWLQKEPFSSFKKDNVQKKKVKEKLRYKKDGRVDKSVFNEVESSHFFSNYPKNSAHNHTHKNSIHKALRNKDVICNKSTKKSHINCSKKIKKPKFIKNKSGVSITPRIKILFNDKGTKMNGSSENTPITNQINMKHKDSLLDYLDVVKRSGLKATTVDPTEKNSLKKQNIKKNKYKRKVNEKNYINLEKVFNKHERHFDNYINFPEEDLLALIFGAPLVNDLKPFASTYTQQQVILSKRFMTYFCNFIKSG